MTEHSLNCCLENGAALEIRHSREGGNLEHLFKANLLQFALR
jgi:hypothetical protein